MSLAQIRGVPTRLSRRGRHCAILTQDITLSSLQLSAAGPLTDYDSVTALLSNRQAGDLADREC